MKEEILEFIKRRFTKDCDWTNGNCLWFAIILQLRFNNFVEIYYLPIQGHFVVGFLGEFFDYSGQVKLNETPIHFDEIKRTDLTWYNRLIRDCFN